MRNERGWGFLLISLTAIPVAAVIFDYSGGIHWAGSTDLDVIFTVHDQRSGLPVECASIEISSVDKSHDFIENDIPHISLTTDENGTAHFICHDIFCAGSRSHLRISCDTFYAELPGWKVIVNAPDHRKFEDSRIDYPYSKYVARRTKPGNSQVTIPILLAPQMP